MMTAFCGLQRSHIVAVPLCENAMTVKNTAKKSQQLTSEQPTALIPEPRRTKWVPRTLTLGRQTQQNWLTAGTAVNTITTAYNAAMNAELTGTLTGTSHLDVQRYYLLTYRCDTIRPPMPIGDIWMGETRTALQTWTLIPGDPST